MTDQAPPIQRSVRSGRQVVPGWTKLVPERDDLIEVELHLDAKDLDKTYAVVLIEFWATPEALTIQSVLPVNAFAVNAAGWCVFVPAQGRLLIRAIDAEPVPPTLASHLIQLDPKTQAGTLITVNIRLP